MGAQCAVICTSPFEAILFHAAALVAFFGMLQVGELMAKSKQDTSDRPLNVDDVHLFPQMVQFRLHYLKTDQKGKGV